MREAASLARATVATQRPSAPTLLALVTVLLMLTAVAQSRAQDVVSVPVDVGSSRQVNFREVSVPLYGVESSAVAWGDYDNDNDLDILLTGCITRDYYILICNGAVSRVYRNDGGNSFADVAGFRGVRDGAVAWGDYDNDDDLDVLLTGWWELNDLPITRVHRNDGGSMFTETVGLAGVELSTASWADYDNDGDLDILAAGRHPTQGPISRIYRNDGNEDFNDIGAGFSGVEWCSAAWADYDKDLDLDLALMGFSNTSPFWFLRIHRNDGGGSFVITGDALRSGMKGSVAWGDYDNDGDPDIVRTAHHQYASPDDSVVVYRNDLPTGFTDLHVPIGEVGYGTAVWGDCDCDGDLDFVLTGYDSTTGIPLPITRVYNNMGGTFVDMEAGLTGVHKSSTAWGDYDNDGDLDILLTGDRQHAPWWSGISRIVRNDGGIPNTPPSPPTNLSVSRIGLTATFSWDAATDLETPAPGLTYNLRVGTTPGGGDVCNAMADAQTGYRKIPALGNTNYDTSWHIDLPHEGQYYWSVQAIDAGFAGSPFAAEQTIAQVLRVPAQVPSIQAALDLAWPGDTVLVACGTYLESTITMKSGVVLRSETGDPACVTLDGGSLGRIMTCVDADSFTRIEGITFTGALTGSTWPDDGGSAIKMTDSSPTILNCRFTDNVCGDGAAVLCWGSSPTFTNCEFLNNQTGKSVGGLYFVGSPSATITDCSFIGNSCSPTEGYGGGMMTWISTVDLTGCRFSGNSAAAGGGLRCGYLSSMTLTGCVFDGNVASGQGGGLLLDDCTMAVSECTIHANSAATEGGGIRCYNSSLSVDRTIIAFSEHGEAIACFGTGSPTLSCCDVYGNEGGDWIGCLAGQGGTNGNFSADPMFCEPAVGDLTLATTSPCLPGNHPYGSSCDVVGALGEGCPGPVGVPDLSATPSLLALYAARPSPFSGETVLHYDLPEAGRVSLRIFDVTGRLIRTVVQGVVPAGRHAARWGGQDHSGNPVASGVYFYQLEARGEVITRKVVRLAR